MKTFVILVITIVLSGCISTSNHTVRAPTSALPLGSVCMPNFENDNASMRTNARKHIESRVLELGYSITEGRENCDYRLAVSIGAVYDFRWIITRVNLYLYDHNDDEIANVGRSYGYNFKAREKIFGSVVDEAFGV